MKLPLLLISILCTCEASSSQSTAVGAPDTIPFQLTDHNNLAVWTVLNDEDSLLLMLHTAAEGVSLISSVTEQLDLYQRVFTPYGLRWEPVAG